MKSSALLLAAFLAIPLVSQAKIQVSAIHSMADSTDVDATRLMERLKSVGARGSLDRHGNIQYSINGGITITNGAACDNGRSTYHVTLSELDEKGNQVRSFDIDDSNGCTKPSAAEKFVDLLAQWGGDLVIDDCGAGHCWKKIESIRCSHFDASRASEVFDSCTVELAIGQ